MKNGDRAPAFELPDENGQMRKLTDLLQSGPVVLFFYPAAMTSVCTKESCHFRDLKSEFEAVGAHRVGISADAPTRQKEFSDRYSFDFPLLSDVDGEVASAYGVQRKLGLPSKRVTFVIGQDGFLIDVIKSELNANAHADQALASLDATR